MPKRTPFEQQIADSREGNGVIRAGVNVGISLLQMIEEDLVQAWLTFWKVEAEEKALEAKLEASGLAGGDEELNKLIDKRVMIRGRVRGIAMCLATVRSPYSRAELSGSSKEWARVIIAQEKEGEARARLRRATG